MLFFFPDRVGVDCGGAELRMSKPALEHMEGDALDGGVDAEPVTQTFRRAMRGIWDPGFDHDAFDDLPDPDPAEVPDRDPGLLARLLGLSDPMGGGQSIEELGRDRDGAEHDLLLT